MAPGAAFEVDHLLAAVLELAAGDDRAWAAGCALVAQAWVEPARRVALRTITLRDSMPPAALTALLDRQPSLAGAVRELVYSQVREQARKLADRDRASPSIRGPMTARCCATSSSASGKGRHS